MPFATRRPLVSCLPEWSSSCIHSPSCIIALLCCLPSWCKRSWMSQSIMVPANPSAVFRWGTSTWDEVEELLTWGTVEFVVGGSEIWVLRILGCNNKPQFNGFHPHLATAVLTCSFSAKLWSHALIYKRGKWGFSRFGFPTPGKK